MLNIRYMPLASLIYFFFSFHIGVFLSKVINWTNLSKFLFCPRHYINQTEKFATVSNIIMSKWFINVHLLKFSWGICSFSSFFFPRTLFLRAHFARYNTMKALLEIIFIKFFTQLIKNLWEWFFDQCPCVSSIFFLNFCRTTLLKIC